MTCRQFRELIDSYIRDELLIETNHSVLKHLESCSNCRYELAAWREMRSRIAMAVMNSADARIDPAFATRLKEQLHQSTLRPSLWDKVRAFRAPVLIAAACVVAIVSLGIALIVKEASGNEAAFTAQTINKMVALAVGDHENCAIHFALEEKPIPLDVAAEKYGGLYKGLNTTVVDALKTGDYEIVDKHSCMFDGRRFAHIVLKHEGSIVSVLVTESDNKPVLPPTSRGSHDGYQTASSFGDGYAFFVISDLSEQDNLTIANNLAPVIAKSMIAT